MRGVVRKIPAGLCFAAFVASFVVAAIYGVASYTVEQEVARVPATDSQELTEGLKAGISHTSEAGRNLTQAILLISAALWGLIIGKKEERQIVLGNRVSRWMTVLSNAVVGVFLYAYHVLDTSIARILFNATKVGKKEYVMHIDNMRLSDLVSYQLTLFIAAAVSIGSTLVYAHAVRQEQPPHA